jgi:hypothetical protein
MHRACSYARVLEAAQKGYGYSAADLVPYAQMLSTQLDRYSTPQGGSAVMQSERVSMGAMVGRAQAGSNRGLRSNCS